MIVLEGGYEVGKSVLRKGRERKGKKRRGKRVKERKGESVK